MNNNQNQQRFQQNMQGGPGSGLTRYRSAPSSYFVSLMDTPATEAVFGGDDLQLLFSPRATGGERISSQFMSSTVTDRENSRLANPGRSSQFPPPAKVEPRQPPHQPLQRQPSNNYSSAYQLTYRGQNPGSGIAGGGSENLYGRSLGSYDVNQMKMEPAAGGNSGLIRHSSSPAGFFANIDMENEFGSTRARESFRGCNNNSSKNANTETFSSSTRRLRHRMDTSLRYSLSETMMNPIPEINPKGMGGNIVENRHFSHDSGNNLDWDDTDSFLEALLDNQNNEGENRPVDQLSHNRPVNQLSHRLSLPTSSAEVSAMETMLQETVPCKMRAKRGFATHPRSIAERVRRTKISERIRKVQELLPNMEKQINTSDILDLAVEYIKNLQRQVKMLSDDRAKCSCPAKHNL